MLEALIAKQMASKHPSAVLLAVYMSIEWMIVHMLAHTGITQKQEVKMIRS